MELACEISDLGSETIVIVERAHRVEHLRETCVLGADGAGGVIANDYWIDSTGPTVWQSRQWAGPYVGYLTTRQLTP